MLYCAPLSWQPSSNHDSTSTTSSIALPSRETLIAFLIHLVHDQVNPGVHKFCFGLLRASPMMFVWLLCLRVAISFKWHCVGYIFYAFSISFMFMFIFIFFLYFEILSYSTRLHWSLLFACVSEVIWVGIMVHECSVLCEWFFYKPYPNKLLTCFMLWV